MKFSISQVSKIAGVSVRTLQFYDNQGILSAKRNPENDYREYDQKDMIILQQILIYREMDFSISQIKLMLNQNNHSLFESLKSQKQTLEKKSELLSKLISKIEVSMNKLDKQRITATLYEGIDKQKAQSWEEQAKEKYSPEKVEQSYQRLGKLSQTQLEEIKIEGEQIAIDIANNLDQDIKSDLIQNIVKRHHVWIEHFYDAPADVYTGLGQMYMQSEDFTHFYDKHNKGSTEHLYKAMIYFAANHLK